MKPSTPALVCAASLLTATRADSLSTYSYTNGAPPHTNTADCLSANGSTRTGSVDPIETSRDSHASFESQYSGLIHARGINDDEAKDIDFFPTQKDAMGLQSLFGNTTTLSPRTAPSEIVNALGRVHEACDNPSGTTVGESVVNTTRKDLVHVCRWSYVLLRLEDDNDFDVAVDGITPRTLDQYIAGLITEWNNHQSGANWRDRVASSAYDTLSAARKLSGGFYATAQTLVPVTIPEKVQEIIAEASENSGSGQLMVSGVAVAIAAAGLAMTL